MSALREFTSTETEYADYIQLRDVLEIRRAPLSSAGVRLSGDSLEIHGANGSERRVGLAPERRDENDCRIVTQRGMQQYHFTGAYRWADFNEIREAFAAAAPETAAFPRDVVFAPLKIVIARRNQPVRAVLTYDPICPAHGHLALLRPRQTLWMAYAALGLLNSAIGQALYQRSTESRAAQTASTGDLASGRLMDLPLAPRQYDRAELERVARLAFQISTLYEALSDPRRPEYHDWIRLAIENLSKLLLGRLLCLLSLGESEERRLMKSVMSMPAYRDETLEILNASPREFPTRDPLGVFDTDLRKRYRGLIDPVLNGTASSKERTEFENLKWLKYWDEAARAPLPEIAPTESPIHQSEYPLRGKPVTYLDPAAPVALHDWEASQ